MNSEQHDHDCDHHDHSRRRLLRSALGLALTGPAAFAVNLAHIGAAAAQSAGSDDYKPLICLFMYGGNDQANTLVATSGRSWERYRNLRGDSIGMPDPGVNGGLLPISPDNLSAFGNSGTFALHPALTDTRALFEQKKLAFVANVGPLIEPITPDEYRRMQKRYPDRLFSHNDQQATWQTFSPEGSRAGWGGNLAGLLADSYNATAPFFSAISTASSAAAWLSGQRVNPYSVPLTGKIGFVQSDMPLGGINNNGAPLRDILNLEPAGGNLLEKTYSELYKRTLQYQERMRSALIDENDSRLLAVPQNRLDGHKNSVIEQLRTVARIIASRQNLGVRRQVFFISLGGFDTHSGQKNTQNKLLAQIDQTLAHFARQMRVLGVEDQVTLFTASDFGRSMRSNGAGTDHGWGSHHLVAGGAVQGGRLYGAFPEFDLNGANDIHGRLVPRYSVEQYAAALGRWFGVSDSGLLEALPGLRNFDAKALQFMRA